MACICFRFKRNSTDETKIIPESDVNCNTFTDNRIPLTERQKFLLIKNWKGTSREVTEAGANMFIKLVSLFHRLDNLPFFFFHSLHNNSSENFVPTENAYR